MDFGGFPGSALLACIDIGKIESKAGAGGERNGAETGMLAVDEFQEEA